jgi:hypothetical protein
MHAVENTANAANRLVAGSSVGEYVAAMIVAKAPQSAKSSHSTALPIQAATSTLRGLDLRAVGCASHLLLMRAGDWWLLILFADGVALVAGGRRLADARADER